MGSREPFAVAEGRCAPLAGFAMVCQTPNNRQRLIKSAPVNQRKQRQTAKPVLGLLIWVCLQRLIKKRLFAGADVVRLIKKRLFAGVDVVRLIKRQGLGTPKYKRPRLQDLQDGQDSQV